MPKYYKSLKIDVENGIETKVSIQQNNFKSRFLSIQLMQDNYNQLYSLDDTTEVRFIVKKPDETFCYTNCMLLSQESSLLQVELTRQMLALPGTLKCEILLIGSDLSELSFPIFELTVNDSLNNDKLIESQNEFSILTQALASIREIEQDLDSKFHVHPNLDCLNLITREKITQWNNQSDFDGDYNELINKPDIPTKISELLNDVSFVNEDYVNQLVAQGSQTHTHANKLVLDLITNEMLLTWNSLQSQINTLQSRIDLLESQKDENSNISTQDEYAVSCASTYILDKMYPMGQYHEAIPSGDISASWKYSSRWENQSRPMSMAHDCSDLSFGRCSNSSENKLFQALGGWASIYRVEGTPFTQNTGVEMKDIKVYGWYNGIWEIVQNLPVPNGNFYAESFNGDASQNFADSIKQTTTSKTIILREKNKITSMNWNTMQNKVENCMYHPFSNIKLFDMKYDYVYICIDLRKVKWDDNGVDDRNTTHYCSNCGGDWWREENLAWHSSWQHNCGIAQPKMIEITNNWRRFSMTTVPENWSNGFPQ